MQTIRCARTRRRSEEWRRNSKNIFLGSRFPNQVELPGFRPWPKPAPQVAENWCLPIRIERTTRGLGNGFHRPTPAHSDSLNPSGPWGSEGERPRAHSPLGLNVEGMTVCARHLHFADKNSDGRRYENSRLVTSHCGDR